MIFTEAKVIKVYYNKGDKKPYDVNGKPISFFGEDYIGANISTQLRFYLGDELPIGITPTLVTKRADGERKIEILTKAIDTSVTPNQAYYYVELQNWYVQKVGKLTIALKVYSGEATIVDDEIVVDDGIRIVVSDIFHIDCAYAPDSTDLVPAYDPTSWDDVLTAITAKLNRVDGIEVVNTLPTVTTLDNGRWYLLRESTGVGRFYVVVAGALQQVELGVGQMNFALTGIPTDALGVGELRYNDTTGSLDLGLKGGHTLKVGGVLVKRVRNDEAVSLKVGQVVYISGSVGNSGLLLIKKADNTGEATSSKTFGIVATAMDTTGNKDGYVYLYGLLQGINLSDSDINDATSPLVAGSEGGAVWLGANGKLRVGVPTADTQHSVFVGYLEHWSGSGGNNSSIYVKVQNGYELGELHDVRITSKVNGDVLVYDSSRGVWKNSPRLTQAESAIVSLQDDVYTLDETKADKTYVDSQDTDLSERITLIEENGGIDFIKVANYASLPSTGDVRNHRLYMTIDTKQLWEWSGTQWNESSPTDLSTINVTAQSAGDVALTVQGESGNAEKTIVVKDGNGDEVAFVDTDGSVYTEGSVTIQGDLTVNGTTTTVNTEQINIEDNIILINKNQTGTPATTLKGGIEVERGDETNYQFVFDESDDRFKVGQVGSLQTVATRQDDGMMVDKGVAYFNSSTNRLETTSNLKVNASGQLVDTTIRNSGTSAIPLIINSVASQANHLQQWQVNADVKTFLDQNGKFGTYGLYLNGNANAAAIDFGLGTTIKRDVADANPALKVNLANASSTAPIAQFQFQGTTYSRIDSAGSYFGAGAGSYNNPLYARIRFTDTGSVIQRDVADANPSLIVNQINASSTGDIARFQFQGSNALFINTAGTIRTSNGLANITTASNASVGTGDNGVSISRNVADANPSLIVNLVNASSTGNIANFQFGGTNKLEVTKDGYLTQNTANLLRQFNTGNIAIGASALNASQASTNYNVGLGRNALAGNTTGVASVAVGDNSIAGATTANYNVGLGGSSGRSITTGSYNTFVGTDAGYNASQVGTTENSTAIGFGAYTTTSNQMVFGNASVTEFKFNRNTSANALLPQLTVGSPNQSTIERTGTDTASLTSVATIKRTTTGDMADGFGGSLSFQIADTTNTGDVIGAVGFLRSGADGSGRFVVRPSLSGTGSVERMTIMPDGKVGIGTSSPSTLLQLVSTSAPAIRMSYTGWSDWNFEAVGSSADFRIKGNDVERIRITPDGKVGIGTTSPSDTLHVAGHTNIASNKIYNGSASNSTALWFSSNITNVAGYSGIIFRASNAAVESQTERMRITDGGKVGIGLTTPTAQFEVKGGTTTTIPVIVDTVASQTANLQEWKVNGTTKAYIDKDGKFFGAKFTDTLLGSRAGSLGDGNVTVADIDNYDEIVLDLEYGLDTGGLFDYYHTRTAVPVSLFASPIPQSDDHVGAFITGCQKGGTTMVSAFVARNNAGGTSLNVDFGGTVTDYVLNIYGRKY